MNLQSYLKALKQPDDKAYAEAEAKLFAMKGRATPVLRQTLNLLVQRSKLHRAAGCVFLLVLGGAFWILTSMGSNAPTLLGALACTWFITAVIIKGLFGGALSKQFSQDDLPIAVPRLISAVMKLESEGRVPLLLDIHEWAVHYESAPRQSWNELYADSPLLDGVLSSLQGMDGELYFSLSPAHRDYILRLLKRHTAFLCGGEHTDGTGWSPPTGMPKSEYDMPIACAILELYARAGETKRSLYIRKVAAADFANHLVSARIVKNYAEAVLAKLEAMPPRELTLLRPAERPPNPEDLLTPASAETEEELLRASEKPPKK